MKPAMIRSALIIGSLSLAICSLNGLDFAPRQQAIVLQNQHSNCQVCFSRKSERLLSVARLSHEIVVVEIVEGSSAFPKVIHSFLGQIAINSPVELSGFSNGQHLLFLHQQNKEWNVIQQYTFANTDSLPQLQIAFQQLRQADLTQPVLRQALVNSIKSTPESKLQSVVINELNHNDALLLALTNAEQKTLRDSYAQLSADCKYAVDLAAVLLRKPSADNVSAVFQSVQRIQADRLLPGLSSMLKKLPEHTYLPQFKALVGNPESQFAAAYLLARLGSKFSQEQLKLAQDSDNIELQSAALIGLAGTENESLEQKAMDLARSLLRTKAKDESELATILEQRQFEDQRFAFVKGQELFERACLYYLSRSPKRKITRWLNSRSARFEKREHQVLTQFFLKNQWADFDRPW